MNRLASIFMNPALLRPAIQKTVLFTGGMVTGAAGLYVYTTIDSIIELYSMDDQLFDESMQTIKDARVEWKKASKNIQSGKQQIVMAWTQYKKELEIEKEKEKQKAKKA